MPTLAHDGHGPDPRLYGHAPLEVEAIDDEPYLTMVGVMKRLKIGETKLRATPELMALRKVLGPKTIRWRKADIDAYVAGLTAENKPLTRRERIQNLNEWQKRQRRRRRPATKWDALLTLKTQDYQR